MGFSAPNCRTWRSVADSGAFCTSRPLTASSASSSASRWRLPLSTAPSRDLSSPRSRTIVSIETAGSAPTSFTARQADANSSSGGSPASPAARSAGPMQRSGNGPIVMVPDRWWPPPAWPASSEHQCGSGGRAWASSALRCPKSPSLPPAPPAPLAPAPPAAAAPPALILLRVTVSGYGRGPSSSWWTSSTTTRRRFRAITAQRSLSGYRISPGGAHRRGRAARWPPRPRGLSCACMQAAA
eukprot:SAG22_NODE_193_length_15643_cov_5.339424_8_plen_240_part_01